MGRVSRSLLAVFFTLAVSAEAACAAERQIAIVQSLTGGAAFVGVTATNGARLAIEEINASNFLGAGNTMKAVVEDDGTDRTQATTIFNRIGRVDAATLMVFGPTSAATALVAAQAANELKLPMMTMTNSIAVTNTGPFAFRMTQTASDMLPLLVDFAVDRMGLKKCAVIGLNDNPAYADLVNAFRTAAQARGLAIVESIGIRTTETDFAPISVRAAGLDIDCVYIAAYPEATGNIAVQLRAAGLKPGVKLIGPNSAASPLMVKMGGAAVEGMVMYGEFLPGGADDAGRKFTANYRARFSTESDNWAPMGYSAVWVIAHAIKAAGPNPTREAVRDAMTRTKDVPVIVGSGKFSIDSERAPHFGAAIMTVRGGQFVQP